MRAAWGKGEGRGFVWAVYLAGTKVN